MRCLSTGRKCDGYAAQLSTGLTWYRPNSVFQSVNAVGEGRALDFFCSVVAPVLSGPLDPYFWTHLVVQFANFEPAVRHSLVAISALYEDASPRARPGALVTRTSAPRLSDNPFGLFHYNVAIAKLRELKNEALVLLVCVLVVCIECLQGQTEAALEHSQHGIGILANATKAMPWTTEYLTPIFRRLSVLPFFWGIRTFPLMKGLEVPVPTRFATLAEAQDTMDALTTRMAHLLRMADIYRYGERRHLPVPHSLASVQQAIREALHTWQQAAGDLASRSGISEHEDAAYCNLLVKFDLCQIWTENVFDPKETSYDAYLGSFATMVRRATHVGDMVLHSRALISNGPAFSFETWLMPFMYFVVMKCRHLATRLQALSLIKEHGAARENLWNVGNMYPIGRRLIEIEHDLVLDESGWPVEPVPPACLAPPPEGKRIRDLWSRPQVVKQKGPNGREVRGFPAGFVMLDDNGNIWNRVELITARDHGADDRGAP